MWRYMVCAFVGFSLTGFFVGFALHFLPHAWWAPPLTLVGGMLLGGGGLLLGLWWADR